MLKKIEMKINITRVDHITSLFEISYNSDFMTA